MYLLMSSGTCVVTVDGKKVGSLKTLDVFGESALFGERKRSATVMAKEELQLLVLERMDMRRESTNNLEVLKQTVVVEV